MMMMMMATELLLFGNIVSRYGIVWCVVEYDGMVQKGTKVQNLGVTEPRDDRDHDRWRHQQRADGQQLTIVHCGCLFNFTLLTLVRLDRMPTGAI